MSVAIVDTCGVALPVPVAAPAFVSVPPLLVLVDACIVPPPFCVAAPPLGLRLPAACVVALPHTPAFFVQLLPLIAVALPLLPCGVLVLPPFVASARFHPFVAPVPLQQDVLPSSCSILLVNVVSPPQSLSAGCPLPRVVSSSTLPVAFHTRTARSPFPIVQLFPLLCAFLPFVQIYPLPFLSVSSLCRPRLLKEELLAVEVAQHLEFDHSPLQFSPNLSSPFHVY
mmetsp:Transcript_17191/g.21428  ORF Transcript_17191/g.21428 Transcript_17191/m.21428 type:complete len:226 (-) Transcript_17191:735-1412(-)